MTEREIETAINTAFAGIAELTDLPGFVVANPERTVGMCVSVTLQDSDDVILSRIENAKQTFIHGLEKGIR